VGVDLVAPDAASRIDTVSYVRADIAGLPLRARSFDLIVSFQVIEHLVDPSDYLQAIGGLLKPEGTALITTPNLLTSDRENPFHVHEYEATELEGVLQRHFADAQMRGIGASPTVAAYLEARLERIRRIVRLDPLGLRRRLPRGLSEWLFGRFALVVRRGIQRDQGLPDATPADFPIGDADPDCLDLLAICRAPRC
jgi:SAM-dependent methyltransferase